jgi:hypothetical protein
MLNEDLLISLNSINELVFVAETQLQMSLSRGTLSVAEWSSQQSPRHQNWSDSDLAWPRVSKVKRSGDKGGHYALRLSVAKGRVSDLSARKKDKTNER